MKNINKPLSMVFASVMALVFIGCSGKSITIENPQPQEYENVKDKGREISASASGFQLLLFIPINVNSRQNTAYALLKDKADGGYITDVKVKESWYYAFVGTVYKTTLTATVYSKAD